jgi:hypothetical protein
LAATGTYYALLFTLAQYLQEGLGDSPLASGLALVPWVATFGLAGQLVRRLPPRMAPLTPGAGCLLLGEDITAADPADLADAIGRRALAALLPARR